ncbi:MULTISPECIES: hypothetical protein [Pseudomonas]|uniref:hypothetical protein n=1 Tax=Pseudomonas TaxID=286 RepID=UPI001304D449|nr:hypothetical protein [Pseudomonas sp. MYb187]
MTRKQTFRQTLDAKKMKQSAKKVRRDFLPVPASMQMMHLIVVAIDWQQMPSA